MRPKLIGLLTTLTILLTMSTSVAAMAPADVLPGRSLPGDQLLGTAAGMQSGPAVAAGNAGFLTVWTDRRSSPPGATFYEYETAADIYGLRLDDAGAPLDPVSFPIAQGPAGQEAPQVAWNGSNWLVVFETTTVNGTGFYYQKSLAAVRVAPDGHVLDPDPIMLFGTMPNSGSWSVASDGSNWAIAYQGTSISGDIMVERISANGTRLDVPAKLLVPETYYLRFNLRLAFAAGTYLLTWNDFSDTKAVRFDQNLSLLDSSPLSLLAGSIACLTSSGSEYYAIWEQEQPNFTSAVVGSRISTAGVMLTPSGTNISGNNVPLPYTIKAVTWDGTHWRVTWNSGGVVRAARVNSAGQVLDPGGTPVPGPTAGHTGGLNGRVLMTWGTDIGSDYDVAAAVIGPDNLAGPNLNLSIGGPQQTRVDVAVGADGYMVAYRSDGSGQSRIVAQPLDANGDPLTAEPVELEASSYIGGPSGPAVAWNGSVYLVTWGTNTAVVAQRLQPDGTKIDPAPFTVMAQSFGPADVAAVGDTFLVTGRKYGLTPQVIGAVGARVRGSDGAVLDVTPRILGGQYLRTQPAVVELGGRWLVAWHSNWTHDESSADTAGTFMSADGTLTPSFGIHGPFSTAGGNGIFEIALASNGNQALMVQSQELTSGVETDLLARVIQANGTVGPMTNLTPWIGNQYRSRAAWNGTHFVVVFTDQKTRFSEHTLDQIDARGDQFGMRISAAGTKIDPTGFAIAVTPLSETHVNVAAGNGLTLLAGSQTFNETPFAGYRIGYEIRGQGGNQWPVPVAGANTTSGDIPLAVTFSSAGSGDPDGGIATYSWEFGDGSTSTAAAPTHTYTEAGNYVATLTVTDNQGASSSNAVSIRATAPNHPPVAVASANIYGGPTPLDVIFSGTRTFDRDGWVGNIQWDFGGGNTYWGATAYNTFQEAGVYNVEMTAWDNSGATGTAHLTIIVTNSGQPTPGDLDGDGQVTVTDVSLAAQGWDTHPGDPGWDPRLDRNNDGHVGIDEVQWIAARWTG